MEVLQREVRKQGQILKAAHQTCFLPHHAVQRSSVREHQGSEGLQAARWGSSLARRPPHPRRRTLDSWAMLGHAFTHYCLFPSPVASLRMFNAVRFLVFSKIAEVFQFWFLSPLDPSPQLFPSLYFSFSYCQVSSRKHGIGDEGGSEQTQRVPVLSELIPLLDPLPTWCLRG